MAASRLLFPSNTSLPSYARTADRAVYIKIYPRPANIAQSRQILSVLQKYGEVVYYQHLKYDPTLKASNSAIALYKEPEEAEKLMSASPLRLELGAGNGIQGVTTRNEIAQDRKLEATEENTARRSRELELRIEPSRLNFQAQIQRQHYYGYFELDRTNVMFEDLKPRVPVIGMADCQVGKAELPLRLRKIRMEREKRERRGFWTESLGDIWRRARQEAAAGEAAAGSEDERRVPPALGTDGSGWMTVGLERGG